LKAGPNPVGAIKIRERSRNTREEEQSHGGGFSSRLHKREVAGSKGLVLA